MRWAVLLTLGLAGGLLAAFVGSNAPDRASRSTSAATRAASIAHAVVTPLDRVVSRSPPRLHTHATFRETLRALVAHSPDAVTAELIRDALAGNDEPVERQYLIFLAPRLLPAAEAAELLRGLTGPGDGEDVVVALAFNGDEAARREFARLAEQPSRAMVRNLVDTLVEIERIERMGNEDARDILRSYRALEVLTRRFYFRIVEDNTEVPYQSHFARTTQLDAELLPLWLARYPGHPGSDDVALMLGEGTSKSGSRASWLNRASVLPDQMRTSRALRGLLQVVESWEPRSLVETMLEERELPNRILLEYVRLRRVAAEVGFDDALRELTRVARRQPHSALAFAWRARTTARRPAADSLPNRLGHVHDRVAAHRTRNDRLAPANEAMELSVAALAFQFRCWERLARLESQDNSPERDFRIAEFLLAHHEALYPVYAIRSFDADHAMLNRGAHGWERARAVFKRFPSDHAWAPRAALLLGDARAEMFRYLDAARWRMRWGQWDVVGEYRKVLAIYEACAADYPMTPAGRMATERAQIWRTRITEARRE